MKGDDYRQQELAAIAQVARDVETFVRLFYESQVNQQGFMTEAYRLLQAQAREVEDIRGQAALAEDILRKLDEVMNRTELLPHLLPDLIHMQPGMPTGTGQPGAAWPGLTGGAGMPSVTQPGVGGTMQTLPQPGAYTGPGPAKMGEPGAGGFSGTYAPQPGAYTGPGPAKMGEPGAGGFSGTFFPTSGSMPGGMEGMSGSVPGEGRPTEVSKGTLPGHMIPGPSPTWQGQSPTYPGISYPMPGTSPTMPSPTMPSTMMPSPTMPSTMMPSHTMPSTMMPSHTMPSTMMPSPTMPSTTMPSHTMPSTTIPSHTMPSPTMPSPTMPSYTTPSTTMPSHMPESMPIPLAEPGPEAVPVLKPMTASQAEVRFLHASPDAPAVDIYVDHRKVEAHVPYQALSSYMPIETGRHRVQVFPAGVSVGALIDTTVDFKPGRAYTITAGGVLKEIRSIVVEDDRVAPKPGFARLKIVHLAPNAPAVDITLPSGKVLLSHLTFKEKSPAIQVAPGTRELDVRLAGKPEVVLKVPKIKFEPNASYTLYITGLVGREPGLSPLVVREQTP